MMRREGIAWLQLHAQVDRGDRDHDPARHPARSADLLSAGRAPAASRWRADSYRQTAAAAATLSDSSPPGCGMRSSQRAALAAAPPRCPALRGRTPRRTAAAAAPREAPAPHANWSPAAARAARPAHRPSSAFDQVQPEVRAHAGAQHLGRPQGRACPSAPAPARTPNAAALRRMLPTLPASCKRSSTTVAASGAQRRRRRRVDDEADARRRLERAQPGHQRSGDHDHAGGALSASARSAGSCQPSRVSTACSAPAAALRAARAQVIALEPDLRRACGRPPGSRASLRMRCQQRVVARADRGAVRPSCGSRRPSSEVSRTGAKLRRCAAHAPCSRSAARCSGVA